MLGLGLGFRLSGLVSKVGIGFKATWRSRVVITYLNVAYNLET